MKKIAIVVMMLALSMLFAAGAVTASNPAYPTTIYQSRSTAVINGYWDTQFEWTDAAAPSGLPASWTFRNKWAMSFTGGMKIFDQYVVEFFSDNTNDAGDYVQICYDANADGGAAPKTGDIRIDYLGHAGTNKTYIGNGTAWTPAPLNNTQVAQSLNVSRLGSSPHWITEFSIEKTTNGLGMNNAIRVAVYDASNPSAGVIAYPPTSQQDVPDGYSLNTAGMTQLPALPAVQATAFCNVSVLKGWTWYFFAHYSGGIAPLTYQWYEGSTKLAGQTSLVLPVSKNALGTYTFYCIVTDAVGTTAISNNVTLTVFG